MAGRSTYLLSSMRISTLCSGLVALALIAGLRPHAAVAEGPARVALDYSVGPGVASCPDAAP